MATDEHWRKQGFGSGLLEFAMVSDRPSAIATLEQDDQLRLAWCHARVSAKGFYERLGWQAVGEELE